MKKLNNSKSMVVYSGKGGVGKSVTTVTIGSILAQKGYKTAIIDADPQASASDIFNLRNSKYCMGDVILERCDLADAIYETTVNNLYVIPSKLDMIDDEIFIRKVELYSKKNMVKYLDSLGIRLNEEDVSKLEDYGDTHLLLNEVVESLKMDFDFILIDSSPYYNTLVENALYASDYAVIPAKMDRFGLEGYSFLMKKLKDVKQFRNVEIIGILPTMYTKSNAHDSIISSIKNSPNITVLNPIRRSVKVDEAVILQSTIDRHSPYSPPSYDYQACVAEILKRMKIEE